eukprot:scaffold99559_cov65-Phaeocystis_antarctica.AAC.3
MSVTLDVSRLSGWLNAVACCRELKGGHIQFGASCGPRSAGGRGPAAAQAALKRHLHGAHVRDAGRVEAQRLVERRRARKHAVHVRDAGRVEAQRLVERRPGPTLIGFVFRLIIFVSVSERVWGGGSASGMHGERTRLKAGERTENMLLMSVTLDVSKLSGWLNAPAFCPVARRACTGRCRLNAGGPRHARSAPQTCCSCP